MKIWHLDADEYHDRGRLGRSVGWRHIQRRQHIRGLSGRPDHRQRNHRRQQWRWSVCRLRDGDPVQHDCRRKHDRSPDDISTASSSVTVSPDSEYNLIGTGGSGGLTNGSNGNQTDVSDADAALGSLANNGGPTETIALTTGSMAIDKGANLIAGVTVPTTDERSVSGGESSRNQRRTRSRHRGLRGEFLLPRHDHGRLVGLWHLEVGGRVG